jgi:hypothetical protein
MISGQQYREFIMPYDLMFSKHYPNFGIHNCGWTVDVYLSAYADIGSLGYLDFGIKSNLSRIKELFPAAILTVILNPDDILERDQAEIEKNLRKLHDSIDRCRIILGSLDGSTPSQAVSDLFKIASEVWGIPVEALVPAPHCG